MVWSQSAFKRLPQRLLPAARAVLAIFLGFAWVKPGLSVFAIRHPGLPWQRVPFQSLPLQPLEGFHVFGSELFDSVVMCCRRSDYSSFLSQSDLMSVGRLFVGLAMKSLRWQASALSARSCPARSTATLMTARNPFRNSSALHVPEMRQRLGLQPFWQVVYPAR